MALPEIHPKRIYSGSQASHDRLASELLKGDPITVEIGGKRHTASGLDIISIPPAPDAVMLERCAGMLHLSPEEKRAFLSVDNSPLKEKIFLQINRAAAEAIEYNLRELYFDFSSLYDPKKPLRTHKDIIRFMEMTSLYRTDSRKKVLSANYCQLLCDVVARYEIHKKDFETLIEESDYVHDIFYSRGEFKDGPRTIDPIRRDGGTKDESLEPAVVYLSSDFSYYNPDKARLGAVDVLTKGRGKRVESAHSKTVRDPLYRATEAGKDSIGDMYECRHDQALPLLMQILSRLYGVPLNADNVIIENDGFYTAQQSSDASHALREEFGHANTHRIQNNDVNVSSGGYTALKIRATVHTKVRSTGENRTRDIEIQIVPRGNRNNDGMRNWHIYNMVRKIAEVTRKRGAVPMRQFEMYLEDASVGSGIPKEAILSGVTNRISQIHSPTRHGVSHIIANSVYNRVQHIPGLVSEQWLQAVLYAIERAKTIHLYQDAKRKRKVAKE